MTQPFDSHESNYASAKGGASKKKVVKKSSTTKPKVVKKVKKPTKSTKKMKGGEETQGATGMPSQYFNASPPAKVSSKTNVQPFDPVYVQNLATYNANGGKKTTKKPLKKTVTKKPLRKPATKKPLKKKGGNSPFELANLLDFSPQEEGSGIMSDLMKFAKPATGGKKPTKKPTKKPVTKKCMKGCKCHKCMKKVVPKKKLIKNKVIKGGANKLLDERNLSVIWNSMFLKKIVNGKKFKTNRITKSNIETNKPYVVFFIDMQNDFMDVEYERSGAVCCVEIDEKNGKKCRDFGSEPTFQSRLTHVLAEEEHSVPGLGKLGNFNVADAKEPLVTAIVSKLESALVDPNCKKIYITRDYHPDGHMSFSPYLTPKPYCACTGGCFPAHCIQGHSGSLVINAIAEVLKKENYKAKVNEKVKVLFKGMSPNCDSFTAVEKDEIDNYSSNTSSSTQHSIQQCSSISGCYEIYEGSKSLTVEQALDFNLPISFDSSKPSNSKIKKLKNNNNDTKKLVKYEFESSIKLPNKSTQEIQEFQVCGLAGDYCVRDTITALAKKFPSQKVVLLGGLTRYPVLPLYTMETVPIHNYNSNSYLPNIDVSDYEFTFEDKQQIVDNFNNTENPNKSLYYYKLKLDSEFKLHLNKVKENKKLENPVQLIHLNLTKNKYILLEKKSFHFITPPEEIARDYLQYENIEFRFHSKDYKKDYVQS